MVNVGNRPYIEHLGLGWWVKPRDPNSLTQRLGVHEIESPGRCLGGGHRHPKWCWIVRESPPPKISKNTGFLGFYRYLGGGNSKNFLEFSPRNFGEDGSNLTRIFFRWVGEKPPTRCRYAGILTRSCFWSKLFILLNHGPTVVGIIYLIYLYHYPDAPCMDYLIIYLHSAKNGYIQRNMQVIFHITIRGSYGLCRIQTILALQHSPFKLPDFCQRLLRTSHWLGQQKSSVIIQSV